MPFGNGGSLGRLFGKMGRLIEFDYDFEGVVVEGGV